MWGRSAGADAESMWRHFGVESGSSLSEVRDGGGGLKGPAPRSPCEPPPPNASSLSPFRIRFVARRPLNFSAAFSVKVRRERPRSVADRNSPTTAPIVWKLRCAAQTACARGAVGDAPRAMAGPRAAPNASQIDRRPAARAPPSSSRAASTGARSS